ncbi:hypothetical protein H072_9760 [Dactylellina haptotyla CBS 200.50]|uniref:CENP-V/GFA domain-containing protein n=1 Tax=Dactylellina haptotyla (strain CBS 200.50) TaxID=1284197 RepID=S8BN42_DACHA|nr:hypothetical protein H072_9760 [Dactylellina haptotyla CBS 200.50]
MVTLTGTCHCHQTEWEVAADEFVHILCHCSACKIIGGGAYSLNIVVPIADCKVTKGELKTYTYKADSGNDTVCYYCPNCTSHPWHHQKVQGEKYVVRTALLQGSDNFKVAAEVYAKDRYTWQPQVAAASFETVPPPS